MIKLYIVHDLTDPVKPEQRYYTSIRAMVSFENLAGKLQLPNEDTLYRWKRSAWASYHKPDKPEYIITRTVARGTGDFKS